jgi:DNA repair exonuclease SbcCD nuclease subunit
MVRIAHIADTHIRNLKYHEEYRNAFSHLYEILTEKKVDYIVHCGDIAHTKTQISPEFVEMCSEFFRNLASIAPTYIILGNHDGNLKNNNRQDALTPIVDALNLPNLHLLKKSGETSLDKDITLNVLSVFDETNWTDPTDLGKINIALYHGSLSGVTTDMGWVMEHGDHDIGIFDKFDYAMLGDIHKTNQILDKDGRIRYPGSTMQQNHAETNDKGFLLWDIRSKTDFSVEHHILRNSKPFVTVILTGEGKLPEDVEVPSNARLRLVSNTSIPMVELKKVIDVAYKKYKPTSVTFLNKANETRNSIDVTHEDIQEDLRSTSVQEKFIKEYLNDYKVTDEVLNRVYSLNNKYNKSIEENESVMRNVNWKLKRLEWDNLFNYGEGNYIDFNDVTGIVGIFGKNFSGKSSIIDSLLFTIYNTTSKGNRKNFNTINQDCQWGRGKVELVIENNIFHIERRCEKYTKKLKGEETQEAKTDLNFWVEDLITGETESLNGLDRNDTDKNIRKYFGTIEDFFLTSMSSQLGSLSFIVEGTTRRKEILAKFLDLEIFDDKFKLAKEDAASLKGVIKKLEDIKFDDKISELVEELEGQTLEIENHKMLCSSLKTDIETSKNRFKALQEQISSIPATIIDAKKVTHDILAMELKLKSVLEENEKHLSLRKTNEELVEKINKVLSESNVEEFETKQSQIIKVNESMSKLVNEINKMDALLQVEEKKIQLLNQVPCGDQFPQCRFIKDAFAALETVGITKDKLKELANKKSDYANELEDLNPDHVATLIKKHKQVLDKRTESQNTINKIDLALAKNENLILKLRSDLEVNQNLLREYEQNKDVIENLEELTKEKNDLWHQLGWDENKLLSCQDNLMDLYRLNGSLNNRKENLEEQKNELNEAREQYLAYDLFMTCMHTNGISLDIIKKKLPVLNEEIASVLANIVDFEVYLENEEKKLDIFIKHPKFEARPLEMGSGAEKTIAAMAIRLALLNVSSLPKGDIFILDEPGTALDEENMEGFIRILDLVKSNFKTVLLISHLDSLKDTVDSQISIEKRKNFALVQH